MGKKNRKKNKGGGGIHSNPTSPANQVSASQHDEVLSPESATSPTEADAQPWFDESSAVAELLGLNLPPMAPRMSQDPEPSIADIPSSDPPLISEKRTTPGGEKAQEEEHDEITEKEHDEVTEKEHDEVTEDGIDNAEESTQEEGENLTMEEETQPTPCEPASEKTLEGAEETEANDPEISSVQEIKLVEELYAGEADGGDDTHEEPQIAPDEGDKGATPVDTVAKNLTMEEETQPAPCEPASENTLEGAEETEANAPEISSVQEIKLGEEVYAGKADGGDDTYEEPQIAPDELPRQEEVEENKRKEAEEKAHEQTRLAQEKAEEARKKSEKRKADDLARLQAVKEASLRAEAEEAARLKAEDKARKAEADAFLKIEEEARRKAAAEAQLIVEEEKRINENDAHRKALHTIPRKLHNAPPANGASSTHKTRVGAVDLVRQCVCEQKLICPHWVADKIAMVDLGHWTSQNRFFLRSKRDN
jgi:hypothetical protein